MINHLNKKNKPQIVDISKKNISLRIAKAESIIKFQPLIFIKNQKMKTKKGNIENIAILAGIMGAKETSKLIPLCHNIPINYINIDISKLEEISSLKITSEVKTIEKTGVEMEALMAVTITALTIYDMCKSLSKQINIKNIKLISKSGGKSDFN